MTPDDWFRRAFVRAFEKIPVKDRMWNEKVADGLLSNEQFRTDLLVWLQHEQQVQPGQHGNDE